MRALALLVITVSAAQAARWEVSERRYADIPQIWTCSLTDAADDRVLYAGGPADPDCSGYALGVSAKGYATTSQWYGARETLDAADGLGLIDFSAFINVRIDPSIPWGTLGLRMDYQPFEIVMEYTATIPGTGYARVSHGSSWYSTSHTPVSVQVSTETPVFALGQESTILRLIYSSQGGTTSGEGFSRSDMFLSGSIQSVDPPNAHTPEPGSFVMLATAYALFAARSAGKRVTG